MSNVKEATRRTPGKSIHAFCVDCVPSHNVKDFFVDCVRSHNVKDCGGDKMVSGQGNNKGACYFFPYRMGRGRPSVKLIRRFCLECMGGSQLLVRKCSSTNCAIFRFRMGKNPARAGQGDASRLRTFEKTLLTGGFPF